MSAGNEQLREPLIWKCFILWIVVDQEKEPDVQFHPRLRQTLRCIGDIFEIQSEFDPSLTVTYQHTHLFKLF